MEGVPRHPAAPRGPLSGRRLTRRLAAASIDPAAKLDLYPEVEADTLSFPSHSAEFRLGGVILADYQVSGDSATFEVQLPSDCDDACLDAHAWAVSAFFGPDPWTRSE